MPIDGCHRSFEELAHEILPAYMARLRESMRHPKPLADFNETGVGAATMRKRLGFKEDPRGCYVLLDQGKAVYVGISKWPAPTLCTSQSESPLLMGRCGC